MHAHAVLPTPGKRLPARRVLVSAFALATTIQTASANITFDLRAFDITTGVGSIANGGKSVMLDGAGNVTLQIWAQVTNAAPVNNIFGVQSILGAIVSSNDIGITGQVDPLSFPAVFSAAAVPGVNNEFSATPDTILDLGTSSTTSAINYPKARKDPTTGGESVVLGSTMFATNNQPAGATVNPITNGYEFLMGTTTFHITTGAFGSSATLNWKIPGFTTAANRAQIATWTDGDGLNNTGSAQFAEMSVGAAVNFSIALSETMWASTGGGSWGQASNWTNSVPAAGSNAVFGSAIVAPSTVTLDGDRSIGIMTFNSPIAYTVAQGTGGTLTGATKIDDLGGSHTIATPVSMAASGLNVNVANAGDTLTVSGAIGGLGGLQKNGAGRLLLTNANTYAGTTTINAGTVELGAVGANAVAGNVTLFGGTLRFLQSEQIDNARTLAVVLGTLDLGGKTESVRFVELIGGAIVGGGQLIGLAVNHEVQSGLISVSLGGNVGLDKSTAGTVTLTKPNSYTGLTTIGAGTLEVNVTEGTAIAGNVDVVAGTLKLNASGATGIAGNVNLTGGTLESNGTGGTAIAGNVNVAGGMLRLLQSNQIADTSSVTVAAGTLDLGANSETVASVQLANGSIIGGGTLTSLSNYDVRTGMVSANLAGNVALTKTTASTVSLSGTNTYQGGTSIAAGVLSITGASALPSGKPVNVATGALHLQAISNQTIGTLTG
ncbi:MAG TPA: autotransporter-associated beta strand repeat-containing protein, partial [Chthoniobacteraceae bacterium]|nr:autotransporter-associated beta strand repeat-containing protein [Chthoniobacteraceae bacterium]